MAGELDVMLASELKRNLSKRGVELLDTKTKV